MNEYTIETETEHELAALWAEIYATEGGDVDAALRLADAQLAELLDLARQWDAAASACQNTTPAPIGPYVNAQTA
jgi:hypothetical protein